tara:strand:+ start:70 stop:576 length:507 start_codon:yes stop_codon:yes gene_type:complete
MELLKNFNKNKLSFPSIKIYSICLFIAILIFTIDRISKNIILELLINKKTIYINDFLNLELIWNLGIGFGLLSSKSSLIHYLISSIIGLVIIFIMFLIFKSKLIDKILFSIILGGAMGNFYDRIVFMAVPDFIDFHYLNFHWFTFNIADIFITIGIIAIILKDLFIKE